MHTLGAEAGEKNTVAAQAQKRTKGRRQRRQPFKSAAVLYKHLTGVFKILQISRRILYL